MLEEQSDLGLHFLTKRLLKHFNRSQKQTAFVVIVALRVKITGWLRMHVSGLIYKGKMTIILTTTTREQSFEFYLAYLKHSCYFRNYNYILKIKTNEPGPEVIKLFSYTTQLSTNFILLINVKMPTIDGILTFISMINTTS